MGQGGSLSPEEFESISISMPNLDSINSIFGPRYYGGRGGKDKDDPNRKKADEGPIEPVQQLVIFTTSKPYDRQKVFQMAIGENLGDLNMTAVVKLFDYPTLTTI